SSARRSCRTWTGGTGRSRRGRAPRRKDQIRKARAMRLTVVGCGDAFGSGGRLQTSYLVEAAGTRFLIDCGASVLIGFNRLGLDPNAVPPIFISHLHGDHYAGLVWWLLHAKHVGKRTAPLTIVGPPGIEARLRAAAEALFPGSMQAAMRHELVFRELACE